jgi:hypothetical protein
VVCRGYVCRPGTSACGPPGVRWLHPSRPQYSSCTSERFGHPRLIQHVALTAHRPNVEELPYIAAEGLYILGTVYQWSSPQWDARYPWPDGMAGEIYLELVNLPGPTQRRKPRVIKPGNHWRNNVVGTAEPTIRPRPYPANSAGPSWFRIRCLYAERDRTGDRDCRPDLRNPLFKSRLKSSPARH